MELMWQHKAAECPPLPQCSLGKERVVMQGVVKALGVLLGRQNYCEENKCEGKLLPSHRTIEVVLLYSETLPQDTLTTVKTTPQKTGAKKLAQTSRNACVSLLCSPQPCFPRRWLMLSREAELRPRLGCQRCVPTFFPTPIWQNGKHDKVQYHSSLHGYSLCVPD